jgi:hypothetical protein
MTRIHQVQEFQKTLQKGYAWQMEKKNKINNKEKNREEKTKKQKHP